MTGQGFRVSFYLFKGVDMDAQGTITVQDGRAGLMFPPTQPREPMHPAPARVGARALSPDTKESLVKTSLPSRRAMPHLPMPEAQKIATGLGWFSLALGAAEILAPKAIACALGLKGKETFLQTCGAREIAAGIGILTSREPSMRAKWVWSRVAGDAVDIAGLAMACRNDNPRRHVAAAALGMVGMVTMIDVMCAMRLGREAVKDAARPRPGPSRAEIDLE